MQMEIFEDMQTTGCEGCWMGMWHRMGGGHEQGFETVKEGFPGGSVLKNPPACRRLQFSPRSGKIPHASEQLSVCATTPEPTL